MDKITIERETLERAIADYDAAAGNDGALLTLVRARTALFDLLRAALAAQPAEPVAWRWKERVNGMSDSDWTVTNVEPPDGVRVIAKEPLYAAQPAPAAVPPDERIRVLERLVIDAAYTLEKARIWNGMGWTYNPLHPIHYAPMRERLRNECDNIEAIRAAAIRAGSAAP